MTLSEDEVARAIEITTGIPCAVSCDAGRRRSSWFVVSKDLTRQVSTTLPAGAALPEVVVAIADALEE